MCAPRGSRPDQTRSALAGTLRRTVLFLPFLDSHFNNAFKHMYIAYIQTRQSVASHTVCRGVTSVRWEDV